MKYRVTLAIAASAVVLALAVVPWASRGAWPRPAQANSRLPTSTPTTSIALSAMEASVTVRLANGVSLTLPADWIVETDSNLVRPQLGAWPDSAQLMAWQRDPTFQTATSRITVAQELRYGLSLPRYLAELSRVLAKRANTEVEKVRTTTTLRADGLPAGEIYYTAATPAGPVAGYQVVLFDAQATHVLSISLGAKPDALANLLPIFRDIVRSLKLE